MSNPMIHGWRILFFLRSECQVSLTINRCMHAYMRVRTCMHHSFIVVFAGICDDVFAGAMNICLGLYFVLKIKLIRAIQSQLTVTYAEICYSMKSDQIICDYYLKQQVCFFYFYLVSPVCQVHYNRWTWELWTLRIRYALYYMQMCSKEGGGVASRGYKAERCSLMLVSVSVFVQFWGQQDASSLFSCWQ